jgi:biofilm PGA synthesis protein PgaD
MKQPLIIESPDLQTLRQRYTYAALTLFFWIFWFYLWIPVISLIAWLLGIETFYDQMVVQAGLEAFSELLDLYITVIMALGVTLIGWALYNQIRFRGKERRTLQPNVSKNEVAQFFELDPILTTRLQQAKYIELGHNEQGQLVTIKSWHQPEDRETPGSS